MLRKCRGPKFAQDSPQQITIDGFKSFFWVDESNRKDHEIVHDTFILKKPCNEIHISSAARATKVALTFRNHRVNNDTVVGNDIVANSPLALR